MSFFEVQFPTNISIGAVGGPEFSTHVVAIDSGFEQRNQRWETSRLKFDVSHGVRTIAEMKQLVAFFRMVKGKAHGFRFKDFTDYTVDTTEGRFAKDVVDAEPSLYASGEKKYQLYKTYEFSSNYTNRIIRKPVAGTVKVYVDGVQSTAYSLDTTTGVLTWNDSVGTSSGTIYSLNYAITDITRSTTTTITVSGTHAIAAGDRIFLTGIGGTTQLNNNYYTVQSVGASTIVINVNSSAYGAYTSGGSVQRHVVTSELNPTVHWSSHGLTNGSYVHLSQISPNWASLVGKSYQVSGATTNRFNIIVDASTQTKVTDWAVFIQFFTPTTQLTWSGEFDVPARFDTDYMAAVAQSSIHGSWESIPLVEIRQ